MLLSALEIYLFRASLRAMDDSNSLSDNVYLQHELPVKINVLNSMPSNNKLVHMNEHNEKVLNQILALDGLSSESSDDDPELSSDLVRIESKLNLLLDMVSIIIEKDSSLPDKKNIILYASHIDWSQDSPHEFPQDSWLELFVWLRSDYPKPFHLYGQVEYIPSAELSRVKYRGLNSGVVTLLEKIIFRHHRRVIAQSRHNDNI